MSRIKLEECENKIINNNDIKSNESILILKMDFFEDGLKIPIIEYEIYNNVTKNNLDLKDCDKVNISIPVSINENKLYLYNSSSNYYNDICYSYTTDNKTDIILSDRRSQYINNNMSLCEANCQYEGYNYDTKESLCECKVKTEFHSIIDIEFNTNLLLNNFIDFKKTTNIYTISCISLLFSKDGLKKNLGSYVILIIIFLNIILSIFFIFKGFPQLKILINNIIKENQVNKGKRKNTDLKKNKRNKSIDLYNRNNNKKIEKGKRKQKTQIIRNIYKK